MNIILLGYRGCGKTTLGKRLAAKTWRDFIDIDQAIRDRYDQRTVAEIWAEHGEPAYRQTECEVTAAAVAEPKRVIALGGGTLMQPAAREAVVNAADTKRIYLHCRPAALVERINADPASAGSRPSLTEGSTGGGDREEIEQVLAERDPVYREVADAVLDVTHIDAEGALAYIMRTYA